MRNRRVLKLVSSVLVAIIIISVVPINNSVAAFMKNSTNVVVQSIGEAIENINFELPEINVKAEAADYCSFNWSGYDKTLTVTGSGNMPNYNKTPAPWHDYKDAKRLVITGDIKSVSLNAFENFAMLEEIVIEAPITYINGYAFQGCTSLKNVILPDTLKAIYGSVFKDCVSLKEIVIPNSVTAIYRSFPGCNLEKITTPFVGGGPDNTIATKTDQLGYMFGTIEYENTYSVKSTVDKKVNYYIPYSLKSVTITQGLYKYNFQNAVGIEEIVIEDTVTTEYIPACFARNCENLSKINIKSSKIDTIGMYAFADCINLTSIALPVRLESVKAYAFENCSALAYVAFPEKDFAVEYASFENAKFVNDNDEEFVTVGDGVLIKYKGTDEKVVVPDGVKRIGGGFYKNVNISEVILPDSLLYLSKGSFYGCTSIESLVIPDSVQTIDAGALSGMCNLKELSVPFTGNSRDAAKETTKPLFGYIFGTDSKCPVCSNKICKEDTQYYTKMNNRKDITYSYVYNYPGNLYTVTVTDNSIPRYAFRSSNVKKVVLGDGVTAIEPYSFYYSSVRNIELNEKIKEIPKGAFSWSSLSSITIPASVKKIDAAFVNCSGLTTVTLSEGIEFIIGSFDSCKKLTSINFPDSLKCINGDAFKDCVGITVMHFGKNIEIINSRAFDDSAPNYESITAFYIDPENPYFFSIDGIVYKKDGTLYLYPEKKQDTVFRIDSKVKRINRDSLDDMRYVEAFVVDEDNSSYAAIDGVLYNKDITELIRCPRTKTGDYVSPETVIYVAENAFYNCKALNKVAFINENIEFEEDSFKYADPVEFVAPNLEQELSHYFGHDQYGNPHTHSRLIKLKLTNQRDAISCDFANGHYCFKEVEITGIYKSIGARAFWAGDFEEFTIPDTVTIIGEGAFNQANIKHIYGGKNIEIIGRDAFAYSDLEYFELPETLTTIGDQAFCATNITEVTLYENLVNVGSYVFCGTKLKKAVINESLVNLSDKLFANCSDLEIVVVGGSVEEIGEESFADCTALATVVIPDNVMEISEDAFKGASEDLVIYCNEGSYAEQYAEENDIKYTTLVVDPIGNQIYTGEALTPKLGVSANSRSLAQDTEYTASYKDNVNVGSAKVIIKGLGDFKHLAATAKFAILPKGAETVVALDNSAVYDPAGITPDIDLFSGSIKLVEGIDYELIENQILTAAGTYNISVSLMGNYDGVVNASYTVEKKSISETDIEYGDSVVVTDRGVVLEEGKDYTVKKSVSESGDIVTTIRGIGNYCGKASYTRINNSKLLNWFEQLINAIKSMLQKLLSIGV
mgnify:CR=1 FL=1